MLAYFIIDDALTLQNVRWHQTTDVMYATIDILPSCIAISFVGTKIMKPWWSKDANFIGMLSQAWEEMQKILEIFVWTLLSNNISIALYSLEDTN